MTVLGARWAGKIILFQINIEDEGAGKATDTNKFVICCGVKNNNNLLFHGFNLVGTLRNYDGNGKGNVKKQ